MVCRVEEGSELPNSISRQRAYYSIIPSYWRVLKTSFSILTNPVFRLGPILSLSWSSLPFGMKFISVHFCLRPTPCPIRAKCWQRQFDWHVFLLGRLRRKPSDCFAVVNIQEISVFSKSQWEGRINMFCHHYANKNISGAQRTKKEEEEIESLRKFSLK